AQPPAPFGVATRGRAAPMTLQRPFLRRAVLAAAVLASAAGLAVPSVALTSRGRGTSYDASWVRAATQAAWRQFGDPTFPAPPVPTPTNRLGGSAPPPAGAHQNTEPQH